MKKLLFVFTAIAFSFCSQNAFSQTTIVNYDFNSGSSYSGLTPTVATNITSTATGTETFTTYSGTASGSSAFVANSTAGNALAMANSSGTNTRYWTFQLGGSALNTYWGYKLYLQAQRSTTGAQTVTIAYSTNGSTYTNFSTTMSPPDGSFAEQVFDLSGVSALNYQSAVYFRIMASGASGTGTLRIDNIEILASLPAPTNWSLTGTQIGTNNYFIGSTDAKDFIIKTNNTEKMRVASGGNVGIGTASAPSQKLEVAGTIFSNTGGFKFPDNSVQTTAGITSNSSPSLSSLLVSNLSGTGDRILAADASGNLKIANSITSLAWSTSGNAGLSSSTAFMGTTDYVDVVFKTYNSEVMRATATGNVGIGTSSPGGKLEVRSSPNANYIFTDNSTSGYTSTFRMDNTGLKIGHNSIYRDIEFEIFGAPIMTLLSSGSIGIGTTNPGTGYLLDVNGVMRANEVKVCLFGTCDFVFDKNYKLMPIDSLDAYLEQNHHLPEVASAKQMQEEGNVSLGEIDSKLLQKVEELTLYMIQLNKEVALLKAENEKLKNDHK